MNNKLHEIHSLVRKTHCSYDKNHKGHVVLTRCSIGHGRLMRNYLLNNEEYNNWILILDHPMRSWRPGQRLCCHGYLYE
jgi:hypothetical protein